MSTVTYFLGFAAFIAMIALIVGLFIAGASKSEQKRKEEQKARNIARQPWDAEGTSGRANR
jgi:glucose uptake protein GlcU